MADPNYIEMFINAYTAAYEQVPQERRNPFDGKVSMTPLTGEYMSFDDVGTSTIREKETRFADVIHQDVEFRRRWLSPRYFYTTQLVDKQDNIALHTDPTSGFIPSMTYAIERKKRDVILEAFDAAVTSGKTPAAGTTFDYTNSAFDASGTGRTIVDGGTGLTVEKLIQIREAFASLDVDTTNIHLAVSPYQKSDLLRQAETQSIDTSEVKALVAGQINKYMGITFVETTGIAEGSSNLVGGGSGWECWAWIPEGVKFASHLAPTFRIDYLPEKVGETWQIKADFGCNAIRMHEDMVLKVEAV